MNTEDGLEVVQKRLKYSKPLLPKSSETKTAPNPLHALAQSERKAAIWRKMGYGYLKKLLVQGATWSFSRAAEEARWCDHQNTVTDLDKMVSRKIPVTGGDL